MNYPGGIKKPAGTNNRRLLSNNESYSNRGMSLEEDINVTNQFYIDTNKAIVHKKPTPIQIVEVNYPKRSAAMITEAYFQSKSTTDYNGIYKGKHIDFEAKETKNKTLFPLANIHDHQFRHMEAINQHGGICFAIIRFHVYDETYFINSEIILTYWEQMLNGGRKSIPYQTFQNDGILIPFHYQARVDYLKIIDQLYF